MENHHSSPTNNANISEEDLNNITNANHINELPVIAVLSNYDSNGKQIQSAEEIESTINSFPPGFRFYPTDAELVTHYLKRKLANLPLHLNKMYELNIYKYNPEIIAAQVTPTTREKVWYIFTPRDRKYKNGYRPNRSAGNGYWKATGADKEVLDRKKNIIGMKKTLVFYIGKAPKGEKTDWIMHEFRVPNVPTIAERGANDMTLDDWVLCKIYKRTEIDNSMFTQRKRSREDYDDIVEALDTSDGQAHDSSAENSRQANDFSAENSLFASQDSTRHGFNYFDMSYNNPFCNMPWSTTSAYDYQACAPQFNSGDAPLPMMIEPISSAMATNTSIGHDHTTKTEGFGMPCFGACFVGGYTGQHGECVDHAKFINSNNTDQCDPNDCVDQYLVNNYEMIDYNTMCLPEYTTNNFVGESSKSKEDC
ncbi:NAC domain-containing protein 2 [Capsicum baccatum]|uniref:NAC domain-containing protein 2 n=1 Tax=Capsicum baccatum TaxID=33114 RepID=A0A2G2WAA3_CAPBA|nr:NAC domain-containing protein 2 [Capsicum baccatum]